MALKMKPKNTTTAAIFGFLDMDMSLLNKFNLFSMTMKFEDGCIVLTSGYTDDEVHIKCTVAALVQLQTGKLGEANKGYIRSAIVAILEALPAHPVGWDGHFPTLDDDFTVDPTDLKPPAAAEVTASEPSAGFAKFPYEKMHTAELVKLRDATLMYQPVHGSSPGSRYFVIALTPDLRVAARWKDTTMSIRVEGPSFKKLADKLTACGFDNASGSGDYCSMHLTVGYDKVMASRCLGAVVASIGELTQVQTGVPSAAMVKHK